MRKLFSFMLMAVGLLISGNAGAAVEVSDLTSLQTALDGDDDNIVLTAGITVSDNLSLDLKGKTITTPTQSTINFVFKVTNGTLSLTNGTITGNTSYASIYVSTNTTTNTPALSLENITINSNCPLQYAGSCAITTTLNNGVVLNGTEYDIKGESNKNYVHEINNNGTLSLGKVSVKNTVITNNGTMSVSNLMSTSYMALTINNNSSSSFTISGGTLDQGSFTLNNEGTFNISGGLFSNNSGTKQLALTIGENTGLINITGGEFASNVYAPIENKFQLGEGVALYDYAVAGTLGKKVAPAGATMKAQIGDDGAKYINLATAIVAAPNNAIIKLLDKDEYIGTLSLSKSLTIDLNGYEFFISKGTGTKGYLETTANLEIKNGTIKTDNHAIYTKTTSGLTITMSNVTFNCSETSASSYAIYQSQNNLTVTLNDNCNFTGKYPVIYGSRTGLSVVNNGTCNTLGIEQTNAITLTNNGILTLNAGSLKGDITLTPEENFKVIGGIYAVGTQAVPLAYDRIKDYIDSNYTIEDATIGSGKSAVSAKKVVSDDGPKVASFNGKEYSSLKDAISAANESTIDNPTVTILQEISECPYFNIEKSMTLNVGSNNVAFNSTSSYITVQNGTFTIRGTGTIENKASGSGDANKSYPIKMAGTGASLDVDGVTLKGDYAGICIYQANSITIGEDATITKGIKSLGSANDQCTLITNNSNCDITLSEAYIGNIVNNGSGSVSIGRNCRFPKTSSSLLQYVQDDYDVMLQNDATFGEVYKVITKTQTTMLKVGEYEYPNSAVGFEDAIKASSEQTPAVLQGDFILGASLLGSGYLDLNGHTLTITSKDGLVIRSTSNLTILDNSVGHTGKLLASNTGSMSSVITMEASMLTIKGGTIGDGSNQYGITAYQDKANTNTKVTIDGENAHVIGQVYGVYVEAGSTFTLNNGSITSLTGYGVVNNGSITTPTIMNINGGTISAGQQGIYHAGLGTLNINGGTITSGYSGIEIRAGVLNMTGGKVISTYEGSESESWGNGNGTTTVGAGIAVVQHTTQQSIAVTISGGDIDAIIPVKLANPQGNPDEYINTVNVSINGGRYKVVNGAGAPFWSITDKFYVSAGKFSHVPAYVVEGKTVVPNIGDDKEIYPWTIGEVNTTAVEPDNGKTNITWQTAADWDNDKVPTSQDKVTLTTGQNIVVSGGSEVAQAYSITIPTGSTLTVESGAKLIVGGGGISNANGATGLKIEPGAQVIVSPDADMTDLYGRVAFTPNVGKYPTEDVGTWHNKPNRYQLVGIPTKGKPDAITKNKDDGEGFKLNQWDVMTGWKAANLDDFSVPFKGFFFWNDVQVTDKASDLVTYYFKGKLFGNKPQTLVFTEHEGFHLFANSYLAEVDIMALIQGAEENVQKAVYVYDPVQERFSDISYATYGMPGMPTAIQPMQGFYFLNQRDENTTAPMDYVSMVWSNAFKVEQEIVHNAPARQFGEQMSEVRVSLTDNIKGRNDGVYLMERDEVNTNANIRKMMNPATSVNVFVANESGNLSQMQSADLDGQELIITTNAAPTYTFSFEWVQGEEYYLNDIVTGASTCMSEGNTYTFTAQPNSTIEGRFFISRNNRGSVVTDMQPVKTHHAAEGIYTVMGQFMGKTTAWKSLPQGVYVVNGVKMVK